MAVIIGDVSAETAGVAAEAGKAIHASVRPIPYGLGGHYRIRQSLVSGIAMGANTRIFEIRNAGKGLMVLTRLVLEAAQTAAGTAQQNAIEAYKATGFTVADFSNSTTITATIRKRTSLMGVPSANALSLPDASFSQARVWNGTSPGTGLASGTMVLDANPFGILPYNVAAAINTTTNWGPYDCVDDVNGTHPFVFAENEGLVIRNKDLNVTSYGITWYFDVSWAEVATF